MKDGYIAFLKSLYMYLTLLFFSFQKCGGVEAFLLAVYNLVSAVSRNPHDIR